MVKQLDKSMVISDEMLVSCLLNLLGLSAQDTLMVLTSTGNNTNFDKVKDVLILQHGRIHLRKGQDSGKSGRPPPSVSSKGKR